MKKEIPRSIFVLRNNDLGDVLVTTPLLRGLRKAFPSSKISIGVGNWAKSLLERNSDVDRVHSINGPWHNKQNCRFPANSPRTFLEGLLYVLLSSEVRDLKKEGFSHGIDVLGSRQGSWLLKRAAIKYRFGVRGYAGGDKWCRQCVTFEEDRNVAEAGLAFLPLLVAKEMIPPRPRIFLSAEESLSAEKHWGRRQNHSLRVLLAPGGGFKEKLWGDDRFSELAGLLMKQTIHSIGVIGSRKDVERVTLKDSPSSQRRLRNFCGKCDLRQSAAIVSTSDFVFTNSSLAMHLAGAFEVPSITLLGEWYDSAKLHERQWGYPEGLVVGREVPEGRTLLAKPEEVLMLFDRCKGRTIRPRG